MIETTWISESSFLLLLETKFLTSKSCNTLWKKSMHEHMWLIFVVPTCNYLFDFFLTLWLWKPCCLCGVYMAPQNYYIIPLKLLHHPLIWTHGEEKLTQFLNERNNFHSNLKFTYETSSCTVNFLDLNVSLRNGALHTDLYIKPTDGHQYLHYQSSHPLHIKNSIPYSQALRVSRIC